MKTRTRHLSLFVSAIAGLVALTWATLSWPASGEWTSIGPDGGTVEALAVDPQTPTTLYAGTHGGGVFKSTDGGASWVNTGVTGQLIQTLAVDPQSPTTVYAAAFGLGGSFARGHGVFKTVDGGGTWTAINTGLTCFGGVRALAIDPQTPNILYVGTCDGVFKSTNGGANWAATSLTRDTSALAIDPQTPTTVYAVSGSLLFKSTDEGANWTETSPSAGSLRAITIDPLAPLILYVGGNGGISKSTDGGTTWAPSDTGLIGGVSNLAIDSLTPSTIYAGTGGCSGGGGFGGFKSTNGGASWVASNTDIEKLPVCALVVDPQSPATLYAGGNRSGVFKSTDSAANWIASNAGLTNLEIYALAVDPQTPSTLYVGTRLHGLFKSTDGGATWTASNAGLPSDWILAIATDPQLPSTMYVVSGGRVFKSTDGGENWVAKGPPGTSTQAIALDPQTPTTIYAGGSKKSTDGGTTWTTIGSPGTVSTLVIDPQTPTTLYAVQKGGGVSKSTDGGVSWNPSSTGLSLKVLALAIDPQTPSTLYAGAFLSGVYKSIDGGANWVASSTGMPTPLSLEIVGVYALAINPQTPDTLYAGTARAGVFKSTDGGTNWTPINTGLINPGARVLAIDPQAPATLYAGTAYSGVFVRNPRFLGVCESAWSIKRFRCDFGNDNTFVLQQDGTPVCGSENCPGPPNACWSAPITQRTFESPGEISWTVGALGDLSVGQDRDVQAYGETFLLARSANSLTVPLAADVGRIWLNDADVTGSGPPGAVTLNLGTGWNHLEWTSYNQNRGTTFAMNFPFAQHVARMTSTPNSCGDGILEACEECDDGNTLDGDCCSSTCLIEPDGSLCDDDNICTQNGTCQEGACSGEPAQDGTVCNDDNACTTADQCVGGKCQGNPLTCGDGMVQESCGEECDDGIANGSNNCCSATCHVVDTDGDGVCDADDPCTGLTVVAKPTIVIGNLHTPPGDDTLSFKGQITLPAPFSPPIDPVTKGVRILIDDTQGTVLDATIPGGAFDLLTKTGWKVNKAGTTWTYRNGLGGILGIFRVTVKIVNETSGLIEFSVSGKNGSYPVPPANLPLRATLVIDAPLATTGQCGEARFPGPSPTPTCNFSVSGKTLTCK